ncbi:MAG TPA: hypothetical protein P5154_03995 [Candidatus Izemoplasmatales bacterium]|nr:hypothetical protein [Candidatus Izemoplasmatales bacterium]
MKKLILLTMILLLGVLIGCQTTTTTPTSTTSTTTTTTTSTTTTTTTGESPCKDTPLAEECYVPSYLLTRIPDVVEEFTLEETFESDFLQQMPPNWLLYSNEEYEPGGVSARVTESGDNRYVRMISDGLQRPMYPQGAPTPTFIFTAKFNLDLDRKGVAIVDLYVPSVNGNAVTAGVSTGAVNAISVVLNNEMALSVKIGGPFYYYSQNNDAGVTLATGITLSRDQWHRFRFEWDAEINRVAVYLVTNEGETLLHAGTFHLSNRFNAQPQGAILVPNVVRVTMPYGQAGEAWLDNVIVFRKEG